MTPTNMAVIKVLFMATWVIAIAGNGIGHYQVPQQMSRTKIILRNREPYSNANHKGGIDMIAISTILNRQRVAYEFQEHYYSTFEMNTSIIVE